MKRHAAAGLCVLALVVAGTFAHAREWRLRVVGGIAFGREWTPILEEHGPDYPFHEIAPFLREADVTMGFVEGVVSELGEPMPWARPPLRSSRDVARTLTAGGFDAVSVASPHIADFGAEALLDTLETLAAGGVAPFGAGANDTLSRMYALLGVSGIRVACLAYLHGVHPGHAGDRVAGANPSLGSFLREDVANAADNAEVVLVFFHWGDVAGDAVDGTQRLLAQLAVDAGSTAVFGLRSQIWQGVEVYKGRPIYYSLADFVSGTHGKRHGRLLLPTVVFDGASPVRMELTPVRVDAALRPGDDPRLRLQPRLLGPDEAHEPTETFLALCRALGTEVAVTGAMASIPLGLQPDAAAQR
jgi:poly-gamma-glutamate synthesis protein (capsule biosynthesis protein)